MNPYNPAPDDPYRQRTERASFPPIAGGARKAFLAVLISMGLGTLVSAALFAITAIVSERSHGDHREDGFMVAGILVVLFTILLIYAQVAAALTWVYKAWSWIPPEERHSRHWKSWIVPSQAAWMLLIPYFHYYWMFVINTAMCDAMDRLRVRYPTREAAPKTLAIAACICQLIVPFPVGSVLWLIFMSKIERMSREMGSGGAISPAMPPR